MRSIQEVGVEILRYSPAKFYAMAGPEYGIKETYISKLVDHFGQLKEVGSVEEILNFMGTKRLIPLEPCVYVVRYDEEFINKLSDKSSQKIADAKIVGCVVCIYESAKHEAKLEKYIPDWSVSITTVDKKFVRKYLHEDFPKLPDHLIDEIADISKTYGHAKNIARLVSFADVNTMFNLSVDGLSKLFGISTSSNDAQIRAGVAARNFKYLVDVVDSYGDNIDGVVYTILSTMIELEKIIGNSYAQSDIRQYVKQWTREDIYNMFMHTYNELKRLRSVSQDTYSSLIYLFSLLQFKQIPSLEAML